MISNFAVAVLEISTKNQRQLQRPVPFIERGSSQDPQVSLINDYDMRRWTRCLSRMIDVLAQAVDS